MNNRLWEDIQAQGDNLKRVLAHLYGPERQHLEEAARFLQNDRPVVMIGVASASYLNLPAAFYLSEGGRFSSALYAADVIYGMLPALQHVNVVINSRSGETAEIVRLANMLVENGIPFLAVTNEQESSLARMATQILWSNTRKDELVSINVVTGMMVTVLALSAAVLGKLEELQPEFIRLAMEMENTIQLASDQGEKWAGFLGEIKPIYLLYRGASRGSAYCARLVLEEVARWPAVPLEAAEFRQGPNEVVDERFGALLFVPGGQPGELNRSLGQDILQSGGRSLWIGEIGNVSEAPPRMLTFPLPDLPDFMKPVLEVVPAQVLAYYLAKAQGIEPGEVRYISKVIRSEEGIPKSLEERPG